MQEDIQWHPPFRGAVKIELEPYNDILEYVDEKTLTKKPLMIDLLVIKKRKDIKIENPIGRIFRGLNILEYKSPTDYISIDDFYKVSAYAYLLKSDANTVDEIKFHDITISFVSSKIPHSVFSHLAEDRGYTKSKEEPGIYYFNKDKEIPIQFIDLSELDAGHKWLVALTNQITEEMLHNIAVDYMTAGKNEYKDVILETVIKANYELIKQLKEEKAMTMSKEIKELFRPEIDAARNEGINEGINVGMQVATENTKKEIVIELHQMGLSIEQISQATKMSEEEVFQIINET